ncbi:hypothetical protein LINGRAHAP2_LOCUS9268 [Linum grandiflorum]
MTSFSLRTAVENSLSLSPNCCRRLFSPFFPLCFWILLLILLTLHIFDLLKSFGNQM